MAVAWSRCYNGDHRGIHDGADDYMVCRRSAGGVSDLADRLSCITDSFLVQLLVFTVVSLVLVYFTRPIAKKMLNTKVERTNLDAVIGARGRAESDIRHDLRGTVRADNKMWTAVLADDSPDISTGDTVIVERIEGVKLIVKKEIK